MERFIKYLNECEMPLYINTIFDWKVLNISDKKCGHKVFKHDSILIKMSQSLVIKTKAENI